MAYQQPTDAAAMQKQYEQQQYQQPSYTAPPIHTPEPPRVNRGWDMVKRVLYGLVILLSIIGIAVAAALLVKVQRNPIQRWRYYDSSGLIQTIFSATAIPLFAIAALWSIAELVTQACKKWRSGIHPGAHVGVFLILWLASAACTGLFSTAYGFEDSSTIEVDYCGRTYRDSSGDLQFDYSDCPSDKDISAQRSLSIATLVLFGLLAILSLALFIGACCDTYIRNRNRALAYYAKATQPAVPIGWRAVPDTR